MSKQDAMSEQGWSPEPWTIFDKADGYMDIHSMPEIGRHIFGPGTHELIVIATDVDERNAARAVARVNAMAGIPDPAALVESHAELLNFIKDIGCGERFPGDIFAVVIARAEAARGRK